MNKEVLPDQEDLTQIYNQASEREADLTEAVHNEMDQMKYAQIIDDQIVSNGILAQQRRTCRGGGGGKLFPQISQNPSFWHYNAYNQSCS